MRARTAVSPRFPRNWESDFAQTLLLFLRQDVLFAIADAFLFYVNHFKLYSSFCASHSKAQKALHPSEGNQVRSIYSRIHWKVQLSCA